MRIEMMQSVAMRLIFSNCSLHEQWYVSPPNSHFFISQYFRELQVPIDSLMTCKLRFQSFAVE